ncbi:hypothetical protein PYCCODRAFT_422613 [Trametes coccinea BRFM310]|uniref:Uncharacterized protein n=1 Tax=Trametes coccinea (strain BRFM310) TaxID=1353009 RepID=A0A1Y2IMC4_TRAC3|nr:hypothetical protein PYCCODRAFT_422613 [Trametes coccinea BRFM310]
MRIGSHAVPSYPGQRSSLPRPRHRPQQGSPSYHSRCSEQMAKGERARHVPRPPGVEEKSGEGLKRPCCCRRWMLAIPSFQIRLLDGFPQVQAICPTCPPCSGALRSFAIEYKAQRSIDRIMAFHPGKCEPTTATAWPGQPAVQAKVELLVLGFAPRSVCDTASHCALWFSVNLRFGTPSRPGQGRRGEYKCRTSRTFSLQLPESA